MRTLYWHKKANNSYSKDVLNVAKWYLRKIRDYEHTSEQKFQNVAT
jgi:hypothetical protein